MEGDVQLSTWLALDWTGPGPPCHQEKAALASSVSVTLALEALLSEMKMWVAFGCL